MSVLFGDFELDQERRQLLRSGQPVPLEPKAYELLSLLVERRPRVLSRPQIRDVVWPGVFVSESTLNQSVNTIRQALDDDARRPRFIRTAHGFGYAFCGEARDTTDGQPHPGRTAREPESSPYPGLRAFTDADADVFFGREVEVRALWEKVLRQKLLAVIGPSGVGKTSFLRAGVMPSRPQGWASVCLTPGSSPFFALAHALTPELAGDAESVGDLLRGVQELSRGGESNGLRSAIARWRAKGDHALLVVDQFEELFTLNPLEVRRGFAQLLGRAAEGDVHVLLSLRDDFLFRCGEQEDLRPVFRDLTPLYPPAPEALRRALVEPAARLGFRFEDEGLVDEMLETVEGERGALPLLAFAVSRVWEGRDQSRKRLTRATYHALGGVSGALAQHAEATLERIGASRVPLVRELFRNLVTAQGTRAVREREELLSVFETSGGRSEAEEVLSALVDARLLTSYERAGEAGETHQQVEIIHESLLQAWPRLVRWQTQDADGAQLRDQLRQAAQLWHDRGEAEDLLWSGTAYRDLALWRERYPGGLSATEAAFAEAATRRAGRTRRRRRLAAVAILGAAVAVAGVTSGLWRRSETARQKSEADALRAEASKLLALGQLELDKFPTAALAYAIKSLELADTDVGRLFALRALQRGPVAMLMPLRPPGQWGIRSFVPAFSPNGEWLAMGGLGKVQVFNRDGRAPLLLGDYPPGASWIQVAFGPGSDVLVANKSGDVRVWSIPEGRELRRGAFEQGPSGLALGDDGFLTATAAGGRQVFRKWPFSDGDPRLVGSMEPIGAGDIGGHLGFLAYSVGRKVYLRSVHDWSSPPRLLAVHPADVSSVTLSRDGQRLAASDRSGKIRISPLATRSATPLRVLTSGDSLGLRFDPEGRRLAGIVVGEGGRRTARLWDLTAPPEAEPVVMRRSGWLSDPHELAFDPSGRWVVTTYGPDAALWPLEENPPLLLAGHQGRVFSVAFTPDREWLASASEDGTVRIWPLSSESAHEGRILLKRSLPFPAVAIDSASRQVAVFDGLGHVLIVPLAGGPARELAGLPSNVSGCVAFGDGGRLVAAAPYGGPPEEKVIRVWDLETGAVRALPPVPGALDGTEGWAFDNLRFLGPDRLLASIVRKGLLLYDLRTETGRALAGPSGPFAVSRDERLGVGVSVSPEAAPGQPTELVRFSLDATPPETVRTHGSRVAAVAVDPTGAWVASGSVDGIVRIGPVTGEEPHVLLGHEGQVWTVAFSPDGRFVASAGADQTVRPWPVPDLSKSPLHTRPYEDLLGVLRSQTNLRAVPDPQSSTGWQLGREPFAGWARLPER